VSATTGRLRTKPNRFGALYRCFNERDELIYVGITESPGRRHQRHRADAAWWPEVEWVEWEFFPTYGMAVDAEREAIENETPVHNKIGRGE
jgi:hypothetical protein